MYKHLLLPTDGSDLSRHAAEDGVRFARAIGAQVTALHATPVFRPTELHAHAVMREAREDEERSRRLAQKALEPVAQAARAAGVTCTLVHRVTDRPWEAILQVAAEHGCDVIFMASHGWSGIRALILGSETSRVLTHAKIPVLVRR
jgi:nucleotide-binding universal stress UspA family protein